MGGRIRGALPALITTLIATIILILISRAWPTLREEPLLLLGVGLVFAVSMVALGAVLRRIFHEDGGR